MSQETAKGRAAPIGSDQLRSVMSHFPSGVVVVTALAGGNPTGMTVQSFVSLSLDPPLCAFCPARSSTTWPSIQAADGLIVNFLGSHHVELCRLFGTRGADRFAKGNWFPSLELGAPVLTDAVAWIECRIDATHPGGDHYLVVASILSARITDSQDFEPLVFFRRQFGTFKDIEASS